MSDKNGIAQVDKPVQIAWRNRRVKTRETNDGVFFLVEMEIDEESWGFLKTIPRNANGEMVLWVTEIGMVTEKKERKPKEKTPHGDMWRELILSGFISCPGLREAAAQFQRAGIEKPRDIFRQLFAVESLSREVGPEQIYAKFPPSLYPAVKTMVQQALRKTGEKQ